MVVESLILRSMDRGPFNGGGDSMSISPFDKGLPVCTTVWLLQTSRQPCWLTGTKLFFLFCQPTGPSCLEFAKKEIAFVFVGHVHVAAARKRSHQWCISLAPNNTKTDGRMTCLCFLRPIIIRSSSYATRICCCHSLFQPITVSFAAVVYVSVFLIRPLL